MKLQQLWNLTDYSGALAKRPLKLEHNSVMTSHNIGQYGSNRYTRPLAYVAQGNYADVKVK